MENDRKERQFYRKNKKCCRNTTQHVTFIRTTWSGHRQIAGCAGARARETCAEGVLVQRQRFKRTMPTIHRRTIYLHVHDLVRPSLLYPSTSNETAFTATTPPEHNLLNHTLLLVKERQINQDTKRNPW